jgi:hypothetical protein
MILPLNYLACVHEWNNKPPQTSILHDNICLSMICSEHFLDIALFVMILNYTSFVDLFFSM